MQLSAISLALTRAGYSIFTPSSIFTSGVNGVWYDPSDYSTLYRDAAGTLPVTAVEQPVGLMLDKSKNGVGTNGAKRVNLLTKTEDFSDAVWLKNQATVSATNITAPNGTPTADRVTATGSAAYAVHVVNNLANTPCVFSASISKGTSFTISVDNGISIGRGVTFDGATGAFVTFNTLGAGYTVSAYSCITHPSDSNYWLASMTVTPNAGTNNVAVWINTAKTSSYASGISTTGDTLVVWGADLRLASEAATLPTYQKITDTWYNTLPGNHAFNSSGNSANFPVLSARYNLLTKTEDFSDAVWSKVNASVTAGTTLKDNTSSAFHYIDCKTLSYVSGVSYVAKVRLEKGTIGFGGIHIYENTTSRGCSIDLTTGQLGTPYGGATASAIADGSGWILTITATSSSTTSVGEIAVYMSNSNALASYTGTGSGTISVSKIDLRVANDSLNQPAYQRVNTATDYDTVGFKRYLRFNGTNQWLQTNSIDFSYTDKVLVSAGVMKLSDSTAATVAELSANSGVTPNTFAVFAPGAVAPNYAFRSSGTSDSVATATTFASPVTNVLVGLGEVASDTATLRINGTQAASSTSDQGTGNFGNYPLYIGARAGSSLWFNGRLYQMVVAGKQASAAEITSTETYINQKTGAF